MFNYRRLLVSASLAVLSASSFAQSYYYPTYQITNNAPNPITNIMMFWQAPSKNYGAGLTWQESSLGFTADGNAATTQLQDLGKPVFPDSLLVMGLYSDSVGEHLTMFMNTQTALAVENIAFGTIFPNTNETQLIADIHTISVAPNSDQANAAFSDIFTFATFDSQNIPNGTSTLSAWTTPAANGVPTQGKIAIWSDGLEIGSFATSVQHASPVPGPSAMLPFLAAGLGLLKRRAIK